jgi:hypothetical protein
MANAQKEKLDTLSFEELKDFVWDKVKKQDESIEQIRDVMLWRTKEFKTMRVEWEIQHEKVKAMDKYLADYIITTDETHGKDMQWRDEKIESQAERIKELEAEVKRDTAHLLEIEDLREENNKLADVIRGLDPTNPILQNLIL